MSDRARRIDRASGDTSKAKKLPNGWLRVDGNLTTVGVFPYRKPDGSIRRELRLPEEVFHKDALESFSLVPVTDDHPPEFLDATNTREYSRGTVGEEPRRDGDFVRSTLFVTDEELVARIETKDKRELSCGYTCDLDETPGVHPQYGAYDVIQRKIRGNHVALVKRGRAGREAAVRMDAAESVVIRNEGGPGTDMPPGSELPQNPEPPVKHSIRIDGIDVEVTTEQGAQMFARYQAKQTADLAELQKKLDEAIGEKTKLTAKLDTALEEVKKKDAELKELPGKLKAEGKARADLEHDARRVLGQKVKLDKLDDNSVRLLALEKLDVKIGEAKQKDPAYVTARFDSELERLDEDGDEPAVSKARRNLEPVGREDDGEDEGNVDDDGDGEDEGGDDDEPEERRDTKHLKGSERADASRDRMVKEAGQAWKKTLKRHGVEA